MSEFCSIKYLILLMWVEKFQLNFYVVFNILKQFEATYYIFPWIYTLSLFKFMEQKVLVWIFEYIIIKISFHPFFLQEVMLQKKMRVLAKVNNGYITSFMSQRKP